jgi:hypothetical protein
MPEEDVSASGADLLNQMLNQTKQKSETIKQNRSDEITKKHG